MKRVVLLVDQKARDLASVLLVGEYLIEFGIKVFYCNKQNLLATVESKKPDILVLSCSEGQYKDVACYMAPHCKIVLMTQEGACATKESTVMRHTFHGLGEEAYLKGLSRVYLWGELSKRWLVEEKVYPEEIIRVVGTSRLDPYRVIEKKSHAPDKKIRVGFASRGASVNPVVKPNPIQYLDAVRAKAGPHRAYLDANREWEDWIWHSMASLRVNLDLIEKLALAGRFEIVFRPDPFEDYTSYDVLRIKYPCFSINVDPLLCNFIEEIDVLVTEFSTTGIEALLLKKPVISTQKLLGPRLSEHNSLKNHLNPEHMRFYWQPADEAEFTRIVNDTAEGIIPYSPAAEQAQQYLKEFYNWPTEGPSSAFLIAKDLESLCNEEKSAEMAQLHQEEYVEHPMIAMLSKRTHLPKQICKHFLLRPLIFDLIRLYHALKTNSLKTYLRMNYYSWHRNDISEVKGIFRRLRIADGFWIKAI